MSRDLSPAAQAVLDACNCAIDREAPCLAFDPEREPVTRKIAAAALRAAVDQTFPDERDTETELIRSDNLAIAAQLDDLELESQP